jgi:hypothetical protein
VAPPIISIGPQLRAAIATQRSALGMLQAELGLGDRWGGPISVETISKIETGWNKAARLTTLTTLLLRLDIPPDQVERLDDGYRSLTARMRRMNQRNDTPLGTYPTDVFRGHGNGSGSAG